jgi:hypothetical protein
LEPEQVSGAEAIEVQGTAQPQEHRRLPRFYFTGLLSVLGGLLLWEVVSRFLVANTLFLAAPSQIFTAIVALARSGELWRHMSISAIEFALGYVIASVLGVIIGFAMAESPHRQARIAAVDFRASTPRRPSRSRRCSFSGSGSASGRRCWW